MQVSVEDPDVLVWLVVVVDAVAVVVVVAAGRSLLCSAAAAAAVGGSAAAGGRLGSAGAAAAAAAVIVAAGGSSGGSCLLLPPAAGDGELRFGAGAWASVAALDGCLAGAAAGLTDDSRLRSLLDCSFLLGLVGRRGFAGWAGEQDQVVFGLGDLADVGLWLAGAHGLQLSD